MVQLIRGAQRLKAALGEVKIDLRPEYSSPEKGSEFQLESTLIFEK
jgi:hypothetical protein